MSMHPVKAGLLLLTAAAGLSWAGPLSRSGSVSLCPGTQSYCVAGAGGMLAVVYVSQGIRFMKVAPDGTMSEQFQVAATGEYPCMTVDVNGDVHVVWDTNQAAFYRKRTGGTWGGAVPLPKPRTDRHWMCQVGADENGAGYWGFWGIDGGDKANGCYFGTVQNDQAVSLYGPIGQNRPPSVLGPSSALAGDGKVHILAGDYSWLRSWIIGPDGVSGAKTIPTDGKSLEGAHTAWAGSDIAVTHGMYPGSKDAVGVNLVSRSKPSAIVAYTSTDTPFPRCAYDPENGLVYVIWNDAGTGYISTWDPAANMVASRVSLGSISGGGRGCGAGGIAPASGGGMYLVYSAGGTLNLAGYGIPASGVYDRSLQDERRGAGAGMTIAPNPVSVRTVLSFTLAEPARIRAVLYTASGAQAAVLVDGDFPAGKNGFSWDGAGALPPDGVYLCRLTGDGVPAGSSTLMLIKR